MKRIIAVLLVICMGLAAAAGLAESADECAGTWYLVYANVTIGELGMNPDGSYRMVLNSQASEITGSWSRENDTVTMIPEGNEPTYYTYTGTNLTPYGFDISFVIRREPGRITDVQLNDYVESQTLPEGITEEEMAEIIQGIYEAANMGDNADGVFGEFAGVWDNGSNGYITIWGSNITAAFPIDGEIQTGFYGNPGEWTREGNTLINTDGTILVMRGDGTMLCSEGSGTYRYTRLFSQSSAAGNAAEGDYTGDWNGIGIVITDASGVKVYAPLAGYDLKIRDGMVYTVYENEANDAPYEIVPESGVLTCATAENETLEYVLYRDGMIRCALTDAVTIIFTRTNPEKAVHLYTITGPVYVPAGAAAAYSINERIGERTFTWSVEGEGVTIDPETGVMTVADGIAEKTPFTVTATPSDGDVPVTLKGSVCSGVLVAETFETVAPNYSRGFTIPAVTSLGRTEKKEDRANSTVTWHYETERLVCDETCSFIRLESFPDAETYYKAIKENLKKEGTYQDYEERVAEINGAPVYMLCFTSGIGEDDSETAGFIYAVRENTLLVMTVVCSGKNETPMRVTMIDLETIAKQITFNPEKAPVRKEDGELSISSKNIPETAAAGRSVEFNALFANAAAVKQDEAGALTWTVTDIETGEPTEGVTINGKGVMTVDKDLTEKKTVEVTASSDIFGTKASRTITVYPVIRRVDIEPKDIVLYLNSDDSATVHVQAEPDFIPEGLEWTVRPRRFAEVTAGENGTATVIPLAAGKGTLNVDEPGGKSAKIRLVVMQPVQSMELSTSGDPVRGGTVKAAAIIRPSNAGDRKVEWALDVGSDVATINEYGRIKIGRDVPDGTVITVICTSNGAKEPLVETIQIVVKGR